MARYMTGTILMMYIGFLNHGVVSSQTHAGERKAMAPEKLTGSWVVVKFKGQEQSSAGIAFPSTSRVPPVDVILTRGVFFHNLDRFLADQMKLSPDAQFTVLDEILFKSRKIDGTLFQGFEQKFLKPEDK